MDSIKPIRRQRSFLPLTRVGLTLIVGAVFVTLVRGYVQWGESLADMDSSGGPESGKEFAVGTLTSVPLSAGWATVGFWAGAVMVVAGTVRNVMWVSGRAVRKSPYIP